jgi:hypothetical protein
VYPFRFFVGDGGLIRTALRASCCIPNGAQRMERLRQATEIPRHGDRLMATMRKAPLTNEAVTSLLLKI